MADQSSVILQHKLDRRAKHFNLAIGLSKSSVDEGEKQGFSGNHNPLVPNKDSTRIPASEMTHVDQDHKRTRFEKLVVRRERRTQPIAGDVKCALEVVVIDDTALIEATAAVTRFKNPLRKEVDVGFGDNHGIDGKKKRNRVFKKQGVRCSTKCVREKKPNAQVVEGKSASEKQKGMKYVYQKKKVENQNEFDKIVGCEIQETDVNLKVSIGNEEESSAKKLVETETVSEKDDGLGLGLGLKSNPQVDVDVDVDVNSETEDQSQTACVNTEVESKKVAYSRDELEALRFVDEPGQTSKWAEVYRGFAPSVAREYAGLVADANNRPAQRFNRAVNCGSARPTHPILSMPPVLPLYSPTNYRKF